MSYNGSGVFNINTTGQPVVSGTVISSTAFNALTADLATGLTTALTKDGQTTPTANIKLGGYKLVNVGTGTAATDAANVGQVQSGSAQYVTASGTDTITGTLTPSLTAYATGQVFTFKAAGTNTGAVTLNIDSLGAKAITKNGTTALAAGDIKSGCVVSVAYDGTQFQLVGVTLNFNGTTLTVPTVDATTSLITRGALGVGASPSYGTSGQVLTSAGSGSPPTWTTVSGTALTLLATLTPTAAANVDFLSTFSSTYDSYLIIGEGLLPSVTDSLNMRFANSGSADSGSNYFQIPFNSSVTATSTSLTITNSVYQSGRGGNFWLMIQNANDSANLKTADWFSSVQSSSTGYAARYSQNAYIGSALSGVRFYWASASNFVAQGKIRVYGISNS